MANQLIAWEKLDCQYYKIFYR